jgi:hypothetical protein
VTEFLSLLTLPFLARLVIIDRLARSFPSRETLPFAVRSCSVTSRKASAFTERNVSMSEKRITFWVQEFKDRKALMLQWIDPDTGRRKSHSAKTDDPKKAEEARGDLEADLNNGRYAVASRLT